MGASTELLVTKLSFTKSFAEEFLGGRPMLSLTQPIAAGELTFEAAIPGAAIRTTERKTGFGDTTLTAGLGWTRGRTHLAFQNSFFVPTGAYRRARVDAEGRTIRALSFGKNRLGVTSAVAVTRVSERGLELSGALGLSFSTRNRATEYHTAPELHFEGAIVQHFSPNFRLGLAGYAYRQLGEDSGIGADRLRALVGSASLRAGVAAIGPVVGYSTRLGSASINLKAKFTGEFGARRRLEGDSFQLSAAVGF